MVLLLTYLILSSSRILYLESDDIGNTYLLMIKFKSEELLWSATVLGLLIQLQVIDPDTCA